MSVVGFDLGNLNCYIAVARQGGIEVITNDYSLHATPSYISFGPKTRAMGDAAKQQANTNLNNTILNFKHLIGRRFTDQRTQQIRQWIPCEMVQLQDDNVGLKVNYLGESRVFTPEQIVAALLVKLKQITENNLREVSKVTDCVVSVPYYFTDAQRRALMAATQMADLNCLRILNESTAVALAYGIYKQDLPGEGEKPRFILFLDVGHAASQAYIVAYNKGKLTILGAAYDLDAAGRGFDGVLREHFRHEFKEKYKIDAATKPRAWQRLLDECEKLKKQMSANSTMIPINIECFMDDKDVSGKMQRTEFEQMAAPLFDKIRAMLRRLLEDTKKKPADIESIEIIGGSSRIPMIKQIVNEMFGKEPKTTMNQDEAVARGCAMQCAILSPSFRVREFSVKDSQPYRIKLAWGPIGLTEGGENDVFQEQDEFPFSKMLTLYRKEPFVLNANYADPNRIPFPKTDIGSWKVMNVVPNSEGESRKVKVKVRINPNGIFSVCSAAMYETVTVPQVTEVTDENNQEPAGTNADGQPAAPENATETKTGGDGDEAMDDTPSTDGKEKKSKTKTVTIDLPIEETTNSPYTTVQIATLKDVETKMQQTDRIEKEKADAKNAVEEYVYEMREKLSDVLADFVEEQDAEQFKSLLSATEDWLYADGEDSDKPTYVSKLTELKKLGDPIIERYREFELRGPAFETLGRALQLTRKEYQLFLNKDEKYAHIEEKDMDRVRNIIEEKQRWMDDAMGRQERRLKTQPPVVFASQIAQEQQALEAVARPILNKPKPKPKKEEPPPQPAPGADGAATNGTSADNNPSAGPQAPPTQPTDPSNVTNMEVD